LEKAPVPERHDKRRRTREVTCPEHDLFKLMPPPRREQLQEQKRRTVSIRSTLSEISIGTSTTSEYLEERVTQLQSDYHKIYLDGLAEIKPETPEEKEQSIKNTWELMKPLAKEMNMLKRSMRGTSEDFDDELKIKKSRAPAETGLTKEGMLLFSKPHET
jgi:hypothetical protein